MPVNLAEIRSFKKKERSLKPEGCLKELHKYSRESRVKLMRLYKLCISRRIIYSFNGYIQIRSVCIKLQNISNYKYENIIGEKTLSA